MQNPIPETYPFPGGGLEGLYLSVEKGVRTVTCIEVIVKGMIQHSRAGTGKKEPTDINASTDEYLRLSSPGHPKNPMP